MRRRTVTRGSLVTLTTVLALAAPRLVLAEPSVHYAKRPAVLPAPMNYGTPYRTQTASVTYVNPPSYTAYARTNASTASLVASEVSIESDYYPRFYYRSYRAPRRVLHVSTRPYYSGRWSGRYCRPHSYSSCRPYASRYGYVAHRYQRRHGLSHYGFSLGYGRHHGGSHGGFSFHFGR